LGEWNDAAAAADGHGLILLDDGQVGISRYQGARSTIAVNSVRPQVYAGALANGVSHGNSVFAAVARCVLPNTRNCRCWGLDGLPRTNILGILGEQRSIEDCDDFSAAAAAHVSEFQVRFGFLFICRVASAQLHFLGLQVQSSGSSTAAAAEGRC
jgi:hypothetical protein